MLAGQATVEGFGIERGIEFRSDGGAGAAAIAGHKDDFTRLSSIVKLDIARLNGPFVEARNRRPAAWLDFGEIDSDEQLRREDEIAWRLPREHEMRWLPDREEPQYGPHIQRLLPVDDEARTIEGVRQVARLAWPLVF